ncbi:MAG: rhodanese-like domain-containing protein [Corynebacteriales bacterium]|nr:rhodanese-like domain-containing protein [Mycobacteriales bacterium]
MPVLAPRAHISHPVTTRRIGVLSLRVDEFSPAVAAGHRVVDIRDQRERDTHGVIAGALAIDAAIVVDRLVPDTAESLRGVTADTRWLLVGADGHDAEWLTWHLHARGVPGARFLLGGHRALRSARDLGHRPLSASQRRDLAVISAH